MTTHWPQRTSFLILYRSYNRKEAELLRPFIDLKSKGGLKSPGRLFFQALYRSNNRREAIHPNPQEDYSSNILPVITIGRWWQLQLVSPLWTHTLVPTGQGGCSPPRAFSGHIGRLLCSLASLLKPPQRGYPTQGTSSKRKILVHIGQGGT